MSTSKLIVVLGMHRSGTSAITRGLQVMGVELGARLMPPVAAVNAKGFWEDIDITELNVKILDALALDWHYISPITDDDIEKLRTEGYFLKAVELLREKIGNAPVYGFKDPRVAKLLPFWKQVFAHYGLQTSYLIALRHPLSVAKSLAKRDGFDVRKSYWLWLEHTLTILANSANTRQIVVDYDRLMQSPQVELHRVAAAFQLPIDVRKLDDYAESFLDKDLRNTIYQPEDLLRDKACPPLVYEIYTTMLDVASEKEQLHNPAIQRKITTWLDEFNRIGSTLALVDDLFEKNASLDSSLTQLTNRSTRAITEKDENIAHLNRLLGENEEHIKSLGLQLSKLSEMVAEMQTSHSWRLTAPLRRVVFNVRKAVQILRSARHAVYRSGGLRPAGRKAARLLYSEGFSGIRARLRHEINFMAQPDANDELPVSVEAAFSVVPHYIDPQLDLFPAKAAAHKSVAVHLHLFDFDIPEILINYLNNIPIPYDIYVSVSESPDSAHVASILGSRLAHARKVIVETTPDRGQDIAPFVVQFGSRLAQYDLVGHIYAKNGLDGKHLSDSCKYTLDRLLGPAGCGAGRLMHIIDLLGQNAKTVYSERHSLNINDLSGWAGSYDMAGAILKAHTQLSVEDFPEVEFPQESMFWARVDCLKAFLSLPLDYDEFPAEPLPEKGTMVHALKRLVLIFANQAGGNNIRIHQEDSIRDYKYYEEQCDYSQSVVHHDIKILAYYLPQFHPTPENDEWHGKGFTEWTKVKAANPLFEGHYQQHIPHSDIGYYLLDSPATLHRQAELMRKSGVYGQVFYHYWFSGKLILENPARILLDNPDINMPFCFCWANENWTRRWDGNEKEILLGQNYSADDARSFIHYLIPFFRDRRYITVDGRPVLFIYRSSSIPDPKEYLSIWESECSSAGLQRPYVVAVLTRGATHPGDFGMDAGTERVLHDWTDGAVPNIKHSLRPYQPVNGSVLAYDEVAKFYKAQEEVKDFTYFRSLTPTWDNTARYGSDAILLHGSTPSAFQDWLQKSVDYTQSTLPDDRRFILVNAWNEWAEGAHLEPDTRFGYSYLNSVGRVLSGIDYAENPDSTYSSLADVHLHIELTEDALEQLRLDTYLSARFISCLANSSIFNTCSKVSINTHEFAEDLPLAFPSAVSTETSDHFIVQFRRIVLFDAFAIERMLRTACCCLGSGVISNAYGNDLLPVSRTENGSVDTTAVQTAPLVLLPAASTCGHKNFRIRSDAHSFAALPNSRSLDQLPTVTTIIRFHKNADYDALKRALYCLIAMHECVVIPMIAAQDLGDDQTAALHGLLNSIPWPKGFEPIVRHFNSPQGNGDLRSRMLNESLRDVTTRYASFLDYDDLLMPNAYSWLIGRLERTGKAISFGRVYSTAFDCSTGEILERQRKFEYGNSYEDFVGHNHAPIHSFMLDTQQIDMSNIVYFDDQRYMEDYLLTLQLFKRDNADWDGLRQNVYIGDYIHSVDRAHTLAFSNESDRDALLRNLEYRSCEQRIKDIRKRLS